MGRPLTGPAAWTGLSLWHETAGDDWPPRPSLPGDTEADVAVVGRNEAKSKTAVAELASRGVRAIAIATDVTDKDAVAQSAPVAQVLPFVHAGQPLR